MPAKGLATPNSGNGSAGNTAGFCGKETQTDASNCEGQNVIYTRGGGAIGTLVAGTATTQATPAGGQGSLTTPNMPDSGEDQAGVFCDGIDDSGCEGTSLPDGTP
jgi:predicted glycosyltransferase